MKIIKPRIPAQLQETDFQTVLLDEFTELHLAEVKQAVFTNEVLHDLSLSQTIIKNSHFTGTDFSGLDLSDVCFENCDFSNADLSGSSMIRVVFKDCKLLGTNFSESYIGQTLFQSSILNMGVFVQTKLENVLF